MVEMIQKTLDNIIDKYGYYLGVICFLFAGFEFSTWIIAVPLMIPTLAKTCSINGEMCYIVDWFPAIIVFSVLLKIVPLIIIGIKLTKGKHLPSRSKDTLGEHGVE
jgi:hypothetical protein